MGFATSGGPGDRHSSRIQQTRASEGWAPAKRPKLACFQAPGSPTFTPIERPTSPTNRSESCRQTVRRKTLVRPHPFGNQAADRQTAERPLALRERPCDRLAFSRMCRRQASCAQALHHEPTDKLCVRLDVPKGTASSRRRNRLERARRKRCALSLLIETLGQLREESNRGIEKILRDSRASGRSGFAAPRRRGGGQRPRPAGPLPIQCPGARRLVRAPRRDALRRTEPPTDSPRDCRLDRRDP